MLQIGSWPISPSAWYMADAGGQISRHACTENTRVDVIQHITDWALDLSDESPPIFWLSGMAGTGKSTIAYTICNNFENNYQPCRLAASFFCSRQTENLSRRLYIIPTIASQIAHCSVAFASALSSTNPGFVHILDKQMNDLLIQPWQSSSSKQLSEMLPMLIVIDALDEVKDNEGPKFVEALIQSVEKAGVSIKGLKFLITSRPDPGIVSRCQSLKINTTFKLEDVQPEAALEDVRHFLDMELHEFKDREAESLDIIAKQSQGIFIYAATAVRYILPKGETLSWNQKHVRLNAIVKNNPSPVHLGKATELLVDTLYKQIIHEALGEEETDIYAFRHQVLDIISCLQQPLSIASISYFLATENEAGDEEATRVAINKLHAVVYISSQDQCVHVYHKSFLDFLFDETRAGKGARCNALAIHASIAKYCFMVMKTSLEFNMCKLPSSFLLDSEVPNLSQMVKEKFNERLKYSCLFWATHLMQGGNDTAEQANLLKEFGEQRSIFWIEAMNLLQEKLRCYRTAKDIRKWITRVCAYFCLEYDF